MAEIIYLSNVRLSFPHIIEPQVRVNDAGASRSTYGADFIMAPNDPGFTQFMQQYAALAVTKWGEHANQVMQMIHADRKSRCYGSGVEKVDKKTFKPYLGYDGMAYITAVGDKPPQMIQLDGKPIDPANTMAYQAMARKMYGGCYVNAAIKPWLQENKHGRGVRCDLVAIQFAKDGEPFGEGVVDASGMFGAVAAAPTSLPTPAGMPTPPVLPGIPGLPSFLG